jgi:polyisoprenoid-binding protein YceI
MTSIKDLTGTYALDPSHTRLGFVTRHAMITKVRGSFDTFEGSGVIDGEDVAKSHATVTIQSASINTNNGDRDNHLRSGDFFGAETYPTITFTSTAVALKDESTFEVTGDLAIKDTTRPVTIALEFTGAATDPFGNQRIGLEGSTVISRADWGITWNAALEAGGVLVSDKITLELEISAIKQA